MILISDSTAGKLFFKGLVSGSGSHFKTNITCQTHKVSLINRGQSRPNLQQGLRLEKMGVPLYVRPHRHAKGKAALCHLYSN